MTDVAFPFPEPIDPWELARELTPPAHASPEWLGFVVSVLTPLARASQEAAERAAGPIHWTEAAESQAGAPMRRRRPFEQRQL